MPSIGGIQNDLLLAGTLTTPREPPLRYNPGQYPNPAQPDPFKAPSGPPSNGGANRLPEPPAPSLDPRQRLQQLKIELDVIANPVNADGTTSISTYRQAPLTGELGGLRGDTFSEGSPQAFPTPFNKPGRVVSFVKRGQYVKAGDLLAVRESAELNAAEGAAKLKIETATTQARSYFNDFKTRREPAAAAGIPDAQAEVRAAQAQIQPARDGVRNAQDAVQALTQKLGSAEKEFARINVLGQQGAVPAIQVERQAQAVSQTRADLAVAKRSLSTAQGGLAQAQQGLSAAQGRLERLQTGQATGLLPAGLTVDGFLKAIRTNDTRILDRLPPELVERGVVPLRAAQEELKQVVAQKKDNELRANVDGMVNYNIVVEGGGAATVSGLGAGAVAVTVDNADRFDLSSIRVLPNRRAIQVPGVPENVARDLKKGSAVGIQDPITGEKGTAVVFSVTPSAPSGAGSEVLLTNPVFANGRRPGPVSGPIRVYATTWPTELAANGSSRNVSLGQASRPTATTRALPQIEQDFEVRIPVVQRQNGFLNTGLGAGDVTLGHVVVKGRAETDGSTLKIKEGSLVQTFLPAKDANAVAGSLSNPTAQSQNTGGSLGGARGTPMTAVANSAVQINVPVAIVGNNTTTSVTGGAQGSASGSVGANAGGTGGAVTVGGNGSGSVTIAYPATTSTDNVPIHVVPTGAIGSGKAVIRVDAPAEIRVKDAPALPPQR